jgi:hypothetical protein
VFAVGNNHPHRSRRTDTPRNTGVIVGCVFNIVNSVDDAIRSTHGENICRFSDTRLGDEICEIKVCRRTGYGSRCCGGLN